MAIFTADEYGSAIEQCLLNGKDITRQATQVNILAISHAGVGAPGSRWTGLGWADILDTDEEDHIITVDGSPVSTRHRGMVILVWGENEERR